MNEKKVKLTQTPSRFRVWGRSSSYLGNIPNDAYHLAFLKDLGKTLKPWGKIVKYGRGNNRIAKRRAAGKPILRGEQHMPPTQATSFCAYLQLKRGTEMKSVPPYWKLNWHQIWNLNRAHQMQKTATELITKHTKPIEQEILSMI